MPWYGVRCVFEVHEGTYEERVTLWQANSFEHALQQAEAEAQRYAELVCLAGYAGLAQAYLIGDKRPGSGTEVYSLIRDSELSPEEYLTRFFDTGAERQQH